MSSHAWENSVESAKVLKALWIGKQQLRHAWEVDLRGQKSYPINTEAALCELRRAVSTRSAKQPPKATMPRVIFKNPRTLAELIPERLIKRIWEENHNTSFESALVLAANSSYEEPEQTRKVFNGIVHVIETAYMVEYWGWQVLRTPKVNVLHRGLDKVAKAAGLVGQTELGFAEFLDDICPCGLPRHRGALSKLGRRVKKLKRPKS
jgi:hypothetical protein